MVILVGVAVIVIGWYTVIPVVTLAGVVVLVLGCVLLLVDLIRRPRV
jgi:hypothetical protein